MFFDLAVGMRRCGEFLLLVFSIACVDRLAQGVFAYDEVPRTIDLGTPKPDDPNRPGSIVLHGGGRISNDVFERFIELAGGRDARIVFVPCAGFRRGWYASDKSLLESLNYRYSAWPRLRTSGEIRQFRFLFTDDPDDADEESFTASLDNATGVWFSGGAQERLNYRFVGNFPDETLFQRKLRRVVERGGVVGGTSAGMAAIPEIMTMWEERDYSEGPASVYPAHGFGLLRQAIVEQHFDARGGRLERFTSLLRDNERLDELTGRKGAGKRMIGLAVEENGALVIQGEVLQAMGNANSHVFLKSPNGKSITWHEIDTGSTMKVK